MKQKKPIFTLRVGNAMVEARPFNGHFGTNIIVKAYSISEECSDAVHGLAQARRAAASMAKAVQTLHDCRRKTLDEIKSKVARL